MPAQQVKDTILATEASVFGSSSHYAAAPQAGYSTINSSGAAKAGDRPSVVIGREPSEEYLVPDHDCHTRKSTITVAVANLLVTIIGAGVLSMPYAMSKTGWALGLVLLGLSAAASDFCMYVLCSASRRCGVPSFTELARYTYGPRLENLVLWCLVIFLTLVLTAFLLLLQDTITSILASVMSAGMEHRHRRMILAGCVWLSLPLCLFRSLHALRHTCFLGVGAAAMLMLSIAIRSYTTNAADPQRLARARALPEHWTDALVVAPIYFLAYLCTFNLLPVQCSLINPTRARVKTVIHCSVVWTSVIYAVVAVGGYLYGLDASKDDILLNYPPNDRLLLVARLGLAGTLFLSIPVILLPARQALLDLSERVYEALDDYLVRYNTVERLPIINLTPRASLQAAGDGDEEEEAPEDEEEGDEDEEEKEEVLWMTVLRRHTTKFLDDGESTESFKITLATGIIMGSAWVLAAKVPGVAFVWALCGSSMGFFIGLTLPTLYYLKVRRRKRHHWWLLKGTSRLLLWLSVAAILLCTSVTIVTMAAGSRQPNGRRLLLFPR